jgi:hypothetical protein
MKADKVMIFRIIRGVCVVLLLVYVFSLFGHGKVSSAAYEDVEKAVTSQVDLQLMLPAENRMIKRLYGLSAGDYEGITLYYPTTNMGAEELLLVKLSDTSQSEAVENAIKNRLAAQKKSFDGYGEAQTALLNASVIDVQGNYILFIVAENAQAIDEAFQASL